MNRLQIEDDPTMPLDRRRITVLLCAALLTAALTVPVTAAEPDPAYWRPQAILDQLAAWQTAHPTLVRADVLGLSGEGRPITLVTLTDHAADSAMRPRIVFHAAQHANEALGTAAIMLQIGALLAGYGHDPLVTARLDSLELVFIPVLNVDGYEHVMRAEAHWEDWRKTLRDNDGDGEVGYPQDGVDLNRNWDWNWEQYSNDDPASLYYKGPYPFSEPEAVALRDWVLWRRPLLVIDYHSPVTITWTNTIIWPWAGSQGFGPDRQVAQETAQLWAAATLSLEGPPFNTTFAFDTLPKEQCWIYGRTGIITYLMEIGRQCWYTGADVDTIAARVARGGTALLDRVVAGPGLRGRVVDAVTGEPLAAEVRVVQMHADNIGPRLAEAEQGRFWRLTRPGFFYDLHVSHAGYETTSRNVPVGNDWATVTITMQPIATGVEATAHEAGDRRDLSWLRGDRRVRGGQTVRLALPEGLQAARCELFDVRGRRLALLADGLAAGREHPVALPGRLAGGVYLLRVQAGHHQRTERLVCVE